MNWITIQYYLRFFYIGWEDWILYPIYVIAFGGIFFFVLRFRLRSGSEDSNTPFVPKKRFFRRKKEVSDDPSQPPKELTFEVPKDTVVSEATRQRIFDTLSQVRSFESLGASQHPEPEVRHEELENSGVIEALSKDLLSDLVTENSKDGKMSRMTVDASLIFDEEETSLKS